jgi:hypothetical protein
MRTLLAVNVTISDKLRTFPLSSWYSHVIMWLIFPDDSDSDGTPDHELELASPNQNSTDEEKLMTAGSSTSTPPLTADHRQADFTLSTR